MKRKIIVTAFLLLVISSLLALSACGDIEIPGEGLSYELNSEGDGYAVTGIGLFTGYDLAIPSEHNGKPVTEIRHGAFHYCTDLYSVQIPSSVKTIGSDAFSSCYNLSSITIASGVENIGYNAFYGCSSLTSLTIPRSAKSIGKAALEYCSSLESITIPFIGASASEEDAQTLGYFFDLDLTADAYELPEGLTSVTVTGGTHLSTNAFYNCDNLQSITLPSTLTTIGTSAFEDCDNLQSLLLPDTTVLIGSYAFDGCDSLRSIIIPKSVTSIEYRAFANCSTLTNLFYTGTEADWRDVTVGADNYPIEAGRLSHYSEQEPSKPGSYWSFVDGTPTIWPQYNGFVYESFNNGTCSVTYSGACNIAKLFVPSVSPEGDTVVAIGYKAFSNQQAFRSLIIPTSVKTIEESAFLYSYDLTTVYYEGSQTDWDQVEVFLYNGHFLNADLYFYSESAPQNYGNYWHYENGLPKAWPAYQGLYFESNGNGTCTVFHSGTYSEKSITIPSSYQGEAVTAIGDSAFYNCKGMVSVTIPNTVTFIGKSAFYGCYSLKSVIIPDSVIQIGFSAFNGCSALESITLPFVGESYKGTGYTHFGCVFGATSFNVNNRYVPKSLKTVTITKESEDLSYAFYDCAGITSVVLPASMTKIGDNAFGYCSSLQSITVPSTVQEVSANAFTQCHENLFTEYESGTYVGDTDNPYAILIGIAKKNLSTYKLNESTRLIADKAFSGCSSMAFLFIPDSVVSIGNEAFASLSSFTRITFSENSALNRVGSRAFYGCTSLASLHLPKSVTYVEKDALSGCKDLQSITLPFAAHLGYFFGAASYEDNDDFVPESLRIVNITGGDSIDPYAFYKCERLTSISIPASVTTIGDCAFLGCTSLTDVSVDGENPVFSSIGSTLYSKDGKELLLYLGNETEFTVPDGVESIASGAFYYRTVLTKVALPSSLKTVADFAFEFCTSLTSIELPIGLERIGAGIFKGCTKLKDLTLPFVGEAKADTANTHLGYLFGASAYDDNPLHVPESLKTVVITTDAAISDWAFYKCSHIASVTLVDSTAIGEGAFYECLSLESIEFSEELTSIGSYSFYGCKELSVLDIPAEVTVIGEGAFYSCDSITEITLHAKLTSIGNWAFDGCDALSTVYYNGTDVDFAGITVGSENESFLNAERHYN